MTSKRRSATDPFGNPDSVSAGWLREAYRRVKALFPNRVSLNMLRGLETALPGIRWTELPEEIKADLRAQLSGE